MGDDATITTPITIPALMIGGNDGNGIKANLVDFPINARLHRIVGVDRDGALDNSIIAHEWGHYISNRLVGNSNGLTNSQAKGLGEGWADFHALLMMVKAEDALVAANANFGGTYAEAGYVADGPWLPGAILPHGFYDGIRRYPYSTDMTKNPLSFRHIQTSATLPASPPPAFTGDNAEVHNTGEVWASMLWGCYASLLRDTARLTFAQAQDRMKRYLVAAYKLTPVRPTLIEARDAIFAAIAASDAADLPGCIAAFAQRGAGLRATSGDRFSGTNAGVVESTATGNDLQVSAMLFDARTGLYCDADQWLDNGETGKLRVTARNTGGGTLSGATITVSTITAGVTFPSGTTLPLPMLAPFESATLSFDVALAGAATGSTMSLTATASHPSLSFPVTSTTVVPVQRDIVAATSATDDVEAEVTTWSTSLHPGTTDAALNWTRVAVSQQDHHWNGPSGDSAGVAWLTSPSITVAGAGTFSMTFRHRHQLEFSGSTNYDGGVIEISTDNGVTWTDVGTAVGGGVYNGTISTVSGSLQPFQGRAAFVAQSASYPAYLTKTITFPAAYLGQTVRLRFGVATDNSGHFAGWDIDDIAFTGVTNTPFAGYAGDAQQCVSATATSGTPQAATAGTAFAATLVARVLSFGGAPVVGVPVTFDAPSSGASGSFAGGGSSVTVQTDVSGYATAPTFTANATGGVYSVVAHAGLQSASFTLTNVAAPDAPINVTVTAGIGSASVSFSPPAFDGGSAITLYNATCTSGASTASNTGTTSPIVVSGLTGGLSYSCTVTASNSAGTGGASASASVTPLAAVAKADFNADGRDDIVWRNTADGSLLQWLMNGTSVLQQTSLGGAGTTDQPKHIADFNGDGKADMIWQDADGTTSMTLFDGASIISDTVLVGAGTGWSVTHVGDFNGDGKADLVWTHTSGAMQVWLMDGPTATAATSFVPGGTGWSVIKVADLNGDGKADIIWQHTTGSVQAWLMDGLSVTQLGSFVGAGSGWTVALTADLDGDGKQDLIWSNTNGAVQAWLMDGLAISQLASFVPPGAGYTATHTGDLNGDGKADILWRYTDGTVLVWLMGPNLTITNIASFTGSGNQYEITHTRDLDGDGKADILWRHPDGTVQAWIMNGTNASSLAVLTGAGPYVVVPPMP